MVLPIYIIGSKVLRQVARDIDKDYPDLKQFIDDMFDTMYESDGIGLAAPQVGKDIRLFVIDSTPIGEDDPEFVPVKQVFINAHIVERDGDEIKSNEGCLSIPGIHEDVYRDEIITIEYYDQDFNFKRETFQGMPAVIMQHEYDHLDGILFTDKVNPLRRQLLKKKLQNISKGIFEQRYKFRLGK